MDSVNFEHLYDQSAIISFVDSQKNLWIGKVDDYTPDHDSENGKEEFGITVIYASNPKIANGNWIVFFSDEVSNIQQVFASEEKAIA